MDGIDPKLIEVLRDTFGDGVAFLLLAATLVLPTLVLILGSFKKTKDSDESRGFTVFDLLNLQSRIADLESEQREDRQRIVALENHQRKKE